MAVSLRAYTHGAHGPPSCPPAPACAPRAPSAVPGGRGRGALHAGGWTVAGTRAWGACVTYQASRAVEARLCCGYPEDEGIHQERHDTCRERACLISLSFAKCIGNTLESLMLTSRIVAQRVSPMRPFSTRAIKGVRVAEVSRRKRHTLWLEACEHRRATYRPSTCCIAVCWLYDALHGRRPGRRAGAVPTLPGRCHPRCGRDASAQR